MNEEERMDLFYDIFDATMPRLGPGDDDSTRKALSLIQSARTGLDSEKLRILDLGCGNGRQTIQLAAGTDGTILALDNHRPYLDELERKAEALGLEGRIRPAWAT